jgi:hypothetical protein
MKRVWAYVSILVSLRTVFIHDYGYAGPSLEERWRDERNEPGSTLQSTTVDVLKDRHVFLVAGIMSELADIISSYYKTQMEVLKNEFGVGTTYYGPPSWRSDVKNAAALHIKMYEVYAKERKPLIVVAHSKGAKEIFLSILRHPNLILDGIVDRVVLIQAAIYGSPLVSEKSLAFPLSVLSWVMGPGILSLDQQRSRAELDRAFEEFETYLVNRYGHYGPDLIEQKRKEISDKIFYVRSYQNREQLSYPIRSVRAFCRGDIRSEVENDGLLVTDEMKCDRLGVDLGRIQSDHIGTTVHINLPFLRFFRTGTYEEQGAFTRALLQMVYE